MGALRTYASPKPAPAAARPAGAVAPAHTPAPKQPPLAAALLRMQQTHGNRAVQQFLSGLPTIQRKCACGGGGCESCKDEDELRNGVLQRKAAGPAAGVASTAAQIGRSSGGGRPLDTGTRSFMESRFGHDFGGVRVHTDRRAADWSRALNAHAFTTGRNIYFAPGQYAPGTTAGRRLLAHELTHVVQQHSGRSPAAVLDTPGDAYEREADAAAEAVAAGRSVRVDGAGGTGPPLIARAAGAPPSQPMLEHCARPLNMPQGLATGFNDFSRPIRVGGIDYIGEVYGRFDMEVEFIQNPARGCDCADFRYMQFIKGRFLRNGVVVPHALRRGVTLDPQTWNEDVITGAFSTRGYGDRNFSNKPPYDVYDDRKFGCLYTGYDRPHLWSPGDTTAELDLQFLGAAVWIPGDPTNPPAVRTATWSVKVRQYFPPWGTAMGGLARWWRANFSPRGLELELPENMQPDTTVSPKIPREQASVIPGLTFTKAETNLGADLTPTGGKLTAKLNLPFLAKKGATVEFTVNDAGKATMADVKMPLAFRGLGGGELTIHEQEGVLNGKATFTPEPAFLKSARAEVVLDDGSLSGSVTFTPESLQLPIPGLTIENASGGIYFENGKIHGAGAATLNYRGLGRANLAIEYDKDLSVSGDLLVNVPGLDPVTGKVNYRKGRLSAEVTLGKNEFPDGLPLERGQITIRLEDGNVSGDGRIGVTLGPVGRGDLAFAYKDGNVDLSASVDLAVPGLQGGHVTIAYRDGRLEGEGEIPIDSEKLPGLDGNLKVWYREGRFGAETSIAYRKGDLAGSVTIHLDQLEDASLALSGRGEASAQITPWLTGTVAVELTPEGEVNVDGQIRAPNEIELFPQKALKKERKFPRLDFPLWGFRIPVIGTVGIVAFVEGGAGFTVFVGPGVLRNITVAGSFGTQEGESPSFDISGEFFLPAGAEAYLFVGGGISLGAAIADIEGSIRLTGSIGARANLSVVPHIGYADGDYYFRGDAELQALAYLRFSGAARAAVNVALYGEVWSDEWPLFDWVYPLGLNVGLKGRIDYNFGKPFEPNFDFEMQELDPMEVVKSAIPGPGGKAQSGPHDMPPPKATIRTEPVPGEKAAAGAGASEVSPEETPAIAPALPEAAEPVAGKAMSPDVAKRWRAGLDALRELVSESRSDPFSQEEIDAELGLIRDRFGFTELSAEPDGDEWKVHARMNPDEIIGGIKKEHYDAVRTKLKEQRIKYLEDYQAALDANDEKRLEELTGNCHRQAADLGKFAREECQIDAKILRLTPIAPLKKLVPAPELTFQEASFEEPLEPWSYHDVTELGGHIYDYSLGAEYQGKPLKDYLDLIFPGQASQISAKVLKKKDEGQPMEIKTRKPKQRK